MTRTAAYIFPNMRQVAVGTLDFEPLLMANSVVDLLRNLPKLTQLSLPPLCLDFSILKALSRHEKLVAIIIDNESPVYPHASTSTSRALFHRDHPLAPDAFPSLKEMAFSAVTVHDARTFLLQAAFPLSNMTALAIHVRVVPPSTDAGELFDGIGSTCPGLRGFDIAFHELKYSAANELRSIPRLPCQHLLPLIQLLRFDYLAVRHPYPIEKPDADIAHIATCNTRLKVFISSSWAPPISRSPRSKP